MKKLALLLLGILLGFLLCYFFFGKAETMGDNESIPIPPRGAIKPNVIKQLDRNYDPRHQLISDSLFNEGEEDNRSSWYALSDLRKYLKYAEFQSDSLGYKMDGIRIYLGAHNPKPGEKVGMTTMFFVPTSSEIQRNEQKSKGSMFNLNFYRQTGGGDIQGADGLNYGGAGDPPNANYPQ